MAKTPTALISSQPEPPEDIRQWHRIHWASPLVSSWIILATLLFLFVKEIMQSGGVEDIVSGFRDLADKLMHLKLVGGGGAFLLSLVLCLLCFYLQWRCTRFFITPTHVYLRQGVLFRSRNQLRLDRLQSLDIEQPLLARLMGLASLKFVTADGSGSENLSLQFIRAAQARTLRHDLLAAVQEEQNAVQARGAGASGASPLTPAEGHPGEAFADAGVGAVVHRAAPTPADLALPAEQGAVVYRANPGRIIAGVLLANGFLGLVVLTLLVLALLRLPFEWARELGEVPGALLGPFWFAWVWSSVPKALKQLGFSIHRRERGAQTSLAISQGLTSTETKALRVERIFALKITQPVIWRPFGWRSVTQITAGQDGGVEELVAGSALLPTASPEEIRAALPELVPELAPYADLFAEPASEAHVREGGFRRAARNTWWMHPLAFGYSAVRYDGRVLVLREGWLSRTMTIIPIRRTQGLGLSSGPVGRALGVLQVGAHTVGTLFASSVALPQEEARWLFDRQRQDAVAAADAARIAGKTGRGERAVVRGTIGEESP